MIDRPVCTSLSSPTHRSRPDPVDAARWDRAITLAGALCLWGSPKSTPYPGSQPWTPAQSIGYASVTQVVVSHGPTKPRIQILDVERC